MTDIWLAADLHLNHKSLVEGFEGGRPGARPQFGTVEEHDRFIVENFNDVVKEGDKLYLLGDISLNRRGWDKVRLLNGRKRAVLGNHDQEKASYLAGIFQKLYGALIMDGMLFTHVPVHPSQLERGPNVHGHLHEGRVQRNDPDWGWVPDPRYRCVSLEQINYRPIHIEEVKAGFGDLLKAPS